MAWSQSKTESASWCLQLNPYVRLILSALQITPASTVSVNIPASVVSMPTVRLWSIILSAPASLVMKAIQRVDVMTLVVTVVMTAQPHTFAAMGSVLQCVAPTMSLVVKEVCVRGLNMRQYATVLLARRVTLAHSVSPLAVPLMTPAQMTAAASTSVARVPVPWTLVKSLLHALSQTTFQNAHVLQASTGL